MPDPRVRDGDRSRPNPGAGTALVALAIVSLSVAPAAWQLKPATLAAFDKYVKLTEARMAGEINSTSPFLWIDRQPEAKRAQLYAQLKRGEVLAERLQTRENNKPIAITDGLIHHWLGTVFLPGATMDKAMAFVKDYGNYSKHFAPTILRSRVISQTDDHFEVAMRTATKKVITVTIDADYVIDYRTLGADRVYTRSVAGNIFEVDRPGTSAEHRTAAEQGKGYLWRLNNYCSFEQRPEGVYEQCESISLTTDIPWFLRMIVTPFVTAVPRETLEFTLGRVRAGVK